MGSLGVVVRVLVACSVSTCFWGSGNDLGGVRPISRVVGNGSGSGEIVVDSFFGIAPHVACCSGVHGIVVAHAGQQSWGLLFG